MGCCCGHGPWHHGCYYACALPYPESYHPSFGRRACRHPNDVQDLADYLQELEEEVARARAELEAMRRARSER